MRSSLLAVIVFSGMLALCAHTEEINLYVSTVGDDTHSGSIEAPFASVQRAQEAVRELKKEGALKQRGVIVYLREGRYFLDAPITFSPEDSGTETAPITYAACQGEKVVLSGGKVITGWKQVTENRWEVQLSAVEAGEWYFRQLFANGARLTRARIPDEGYLVSTGALSAYAKRAKKRYGGYSGTRALRKEHPDAYCGFSFNPGDIEAWTNIEDAEVMTWHSWECSWQTIRDIDYEKNDLHFNTPCRYPVGFFSPHCRYRVENVPEALTMPGEWYLDKKRGLLTYLARPGEDPNSMEFIAPVLEKLLVLNGNPKENKPVSHITFTGLSFQHARYPMGIYDVAPDWPKQALEAGLDWPETFAPGYTDAQASPRCGQAIEFNATYRCRFMLCEVAHVGGTAVRISRWSHENQILLCTLQDLGGGGVYVGSDVRLVEKSKLPFEAAPARNSILYTSIHDAGRVHPSAVGIWIAQSHHNRVSYNELYNLGYSGISLGWTWGREKNYSDHNLIEGNHIHHVLRELADGGGIYTLGVLEGCILRGNYIHDITRTEGAIGSHNNGFFFDEGSQKLLVEGNVIHSITAKDVRFNQNKREDHNWVNNIFEEEGGDINSPQAQQIIEKAGIPTL